MGTSPATAAMLITPCRTSHTVIALATSRENGSRVRAATRMPVQASAANNATTSRVPSRPSSSPMIPRMKSVCALGR